MKLKNTNYFILIRIIISTILYFITYLSNKNTNIIFIMIYIIMGYDVLIKSVKNIISWDFFDENFLMSFATLGAFLINEFHEAAAVMFLYQIGEYLRELSIRKSKNSINSLLELRNKIYSKLVNEKIVEIDYREICEGDIILLKKGEKLPVDSVLIDEYASMDTSDITGESIPKDFSNGDNLISGYINFYNPIKVKSITNYENSTISKLEKLIKNVSEKKSRTESFIRDFSNIYTPIVTISAFLLIIIPTLIYGNFDEWFYRALIFLVISCPCAFVISVPLTYFAGIGKCAQKGIMVKGSDFLETATKLNKVFFDKTGTITKGNFKLTKINISEEYNTDKIFNMISAIESLSDHPIAKAINEYFGSNFNIDKIDDFTEIHGKGLKCNYQGKQVIIGTKLFLNENDIYFDMNNELGTIVHIAIDVKYIGYLVINDEVKEEANETISKLKKDFNLETLMVTGDKREISEYIANKVGIDKVYSELLPEGKLNILKKNIDENRLNAFVGDGVNDAPSMAYADLSISMGNKGSDIAIEISDVMIMNDNLKSIYNFFNISKNTKKIVWQNIILSLGIKFLFLTLAIFGFTNLHFAVLADVGLTLIAILNAMRLFYIKI